MALAGGKPCIVLLRYAYATKLMRTHAWLITINKEQLERFHVRLLYKIDIKVQIAFNAIYDQVCNAQTNNFIIDKSIFNTLNRKIKKTFIGLIQNKVADFHLPTQLKIISTRRIKSNRKEVPMIMGKCKQSKRTETTPVARNLNWKEGFSNFWCLPEGANFNYFSGNHAKCNASVAKISELKFRHHMQKGSFKKTPLCIPFVVGQWCSKRKSYSKNHSWRKDLKSLPAQSETIGKVGKLLKDLYEW